MAHSATPVQFQNALERIIETSLTSDVVVGVNVDDISNYPKYKEFLHAMETRHVRYNETIDFLEEQEKEGKVFIIRPEAKVEVGRIEKDKAKLTVLYKQGLHDGEKAVEAMKEYLEK